MRIGIENGNEGNWNEEYENEYPSIRNDSPPSGIEVLIPYYKIVNSNTNT